ncbi:hypothetical protein BM531_23840 [Clostridioides difficile]|nr:hypothetical protein BM531_23840 [Clostridioides difficile]
MLATDYTNGLALQAIKSIFEYLPRAYDNGAKDPEAREKMQMLLQWQVWLLQMHFWVFVTLWLIN